MAKVHLKMDILPARLLRELVAAAVRAHVEMGSPHSDPHLQGKFAEDVKLRFIEILRRDMEIGEECGMRPYCHETSKTDPWTEEGDKVLEEANY
jgi:hypothetical protein